MWPENTRRKIVKLSSLSKGTVNPLAWDIPRTGLLAGLFLAITGAVAGTLSAPNAFGMASVIRRIRLIANSGLSIIDISGPGYDYLLRDFLETYNDVVNQSTARNAVTATTFVLHKYFPIALNAKDPLGLIALQNEMTALQLQVEFEADASVATGATVTATVVPYLELFTLPVNPEDWPPLNYLQTYTEESQSVAAAGDVNYQWPRGNIYAQLLHGAGIAQAPADNFTVAKVRVNQSDYLLDAAPAFLDMEYSRFRGRTRLAGVIPVDMLGTSGLGNYGSARDLFDSNLVTDIVSVITFAAAGTLYTVKRQLVNLAPPQGAQ